MRILWIGDKHNTVREFEFTVTKMLLILAIFFTVIWSMNWVSVQFVSQSTAKAMHFENQHPLSGYAKLDESSKLIMLESYVLQLERRIEQFAMGGVDVITRYEDLYQRNPFINEGQGGGFRSLQTPGVGANLSGVQMDQLAQRLIMLDQRSSVLEQQHASPGNTLFPLGYPLATLVNPTSTTGYRPDPFTGQAAWHDGIDLPASYGTSILATGSGTVIRAGWDPELGNVVEIEHSPQLVSRYAHAQELMVRFGEKVNHGQVIATVGSTGRSTGPHLHYEILRNMAAQNALSRQQR